MRRRIHVPVHVPGSLARKDTARRSKLREADKFLRPQGRNTHPVRVLPLRLTLTPDREQSLVHASHVAIADTSTDMAATRCAEHMRTYSGRLLSVCSHDLDQDQHSKPKQPTHCRQSEHVDVGQPLKHLEHCCAAGLGLTGARGCCASGSGSQGLHVDCPAAAGGCAVCFQ